MLLRALVLLALGALVVVMAGRWLRSAGRGTPSAPDMLEARHRCPSCGAFMVEAAPCRCGRGG